MEEKQCRSCFYFCQHYIPWYDDTYLPTEYGHCIYAPTKVRRPNKPACEHFLARENRP